MFLSLVSKYTVFSGLKCNYFNMPKESLDQDCSLGCYNQMHTIVDEGQVFEPTDPGVDALHEEPGNLHEVTPGLNLLRWLYSAATAMQPRVHRLFQALLHGVHLC